MSSNLSKLLSSKQCMNRPFPSSLVPLFQNESKCETLHMKMSSACSFIFMQIKLIFIRMVSHLDSLWNRGTRELGNGLLPIGFRAFSTESRDLLYSQPVMITFLGKAIAIWLQNLETKAARSKVTRLFFCLLHSGLYLNVKCLLLQLLQFSCQAKFCRLLQVNWIGFSCEEQFFECRDG